MSELERGTIWRGAGEVPTGLGFHHSEDIGGAAAFVFVVPFGDVARLGRPKRAYIGMQHHGLFVQELPAPAGRPRSATFATPYDPSPRHGMAGEGGPYPSRLLLYDGQTGNYRLRSQDRTRLTAQAAPLRKGLETELGHEFVKGVSLDHRQVEAVGHPPNPLVGQRFSNPAAVDAGRRSRSPASNGLTRQDYHSPT